jgi:hypothetical protein
MNSVINSANIEVSAIILAINNDIGKIVEKHLIPHFEEMLREKHNMKLIETVLRQMPDFKRLEQENEAMRRELDIKRVQMPAPAALAPAHYCPPTTILMCPYHNTCVGPSPEPTVPEPAAQENLIKLEIVEKAPNTENVISEKDIYSDVNLTTPLNNTQVSAGALDEDEEVEDETEEAASEVEEEAESEVEEEAESEVEEEEASEVEEEEASEAEEEESEAEEVEEEEASEVEEEEASEVEEVDTLEEEEASEVEEVDTLEEEEASEAEEEAEEEESGVEGGDPLEEEADPLEADEVFLVEIKGRGKFYTNNETNGDIYEIEGEDDVGEEVGKFVNKVATFF